jgi:hypothetical protein
MADPDVGDDADPYADPYVDPYADPYDYGWYDNVPVPAPAPAPAAGSRQACIDDCIGRGVVPRICYRRCR